MLLLKWSLNSDHYLSVVRDPSWQLPYSNGVLSSLPCNLKIIIETKNGEFKKTAIDLRFAPWDLVLQHGRAHGATSAVLCSKLSLYLFRQCAEVFSEKIKQNLF
jgi:hypothetical protein